MIVSHRMAIPLPPSYAAAMHTILRPARNPLILLALLTTAPSARPTEMARWQMQAARVTITRDDWGIPHIQGRSDADAVFGLIYAQAEDDFARIEANYLTALGRTAEADGGDAVWADLRQRLFVDPSVLRADYTASPLWLRKLMQAWADGLNYYLATRCCQSNANRSPHDGCRSLSTTA
jgi:acyl-homoserine-lactone acylase